MKKILKAIGIFCTTAFIIFNLVWFSNYLMYRKFTDGLQEIMSFSAYDILVDGYGYHVKFPDYLSFTGNLAVITEDNKYTLIIWPSLFAETKYGVMVVTESNEYTDFFVQIMIDRDLVSEYDDDQALIDQHRENIEDLFQKANARWGTEFE
jgi:hypothetical protein